MNERTNCINCGAPLDPTVPRCTYCATCQVFDRTKPWNTILDNRKVRTKAIYPLMILCGLIIFFYIYGCAFDDFSESRLIAVTPLWFFSFIFGLYGFGSERLMRVMIVSNSGSFADAARKLVRRWFGLNFLLGLLAAIFLLPFLFLPTKNSLAAAFGGAFFWAMLLFIFLKFVFPAL